MTSKQYLSSYRILEKRVEAKTEQLQRLRARMMSMTASYSDMPRGGNGKKDWTDIADKCVELENQIAGELADLIHLRHDIMCSIEGLESVIHRTVLEMRYLNGWSWQKITRKLNYAESSVYEIHYHALRALKVPESEEQK